MMDLDYILDEIATTKALWCPDDYEEVDLADSVSYAINKGMPLISVSPRFITKLWAWLEKTHIAIYARFYLIFDKRRLNEQDIADLVVNINACLKGGADGAQVFLGCSDLETFVSKTSLVFGDLFFNKKLSICLDISEIKPSEMERIFDILKQLHASNLTLVSVKKRDNKSDFTGQLYNILDLWDTGSALNLHFILNKDLVKAQQAYRLVQKMRPDLLNNVKIFMTNK